MRWKLLRRRLSVSAPRMTVRSHLPWPLRWAVRALALGLSAALALWAFEFGKGLAGLDQGLKTELTELRERLARVDAERDRAVSVANTAESLLRAERTTREQLAQQLKNVEADNARLQADLAFFETLLPAGSGEDVAIRSIQAEPREGEGLRLQVLMFRPGRQAQDLVGRYAVTLSGTLNGRPWTEEADVGGGALRLREYARIDRSVAHPVGAVVKAVQIRVFDQSGALRASRELRL